MAAQWYVFIVTTALLILQTSSSSVEYTAIEDWTHKTQSGVKETATVTLSVANRHSEMEIHSAYSDIKYRLEVQFHNRKCSPQFLNETLSQTSMTSLDFLIEIVSESKLGPDEMFFQVEGPSLQTLPLYTDDFCSSYSTEFFVPVSGVYRLKVFRTRSQYTAIIENEPAVFPKMSYEVFIDRIISTPLEKSSNLCQNPNLVDGFWTTNKNPFHKSALLIEPGIPNSDRHLPIFTYIKLSEKMYHRKCGIEIENFHWNNSLCDHGIGKSQEGSYISKQRASEILTDKKIVFVGDSHMRGLADTFMELNCDLKKWVHKNTGQEDSSFQTHTVGDYQPLCKGITYR